MPKIDILVIQPIDKLIIFAQNFYQHYSFLKL